MWNILPVRRSFAGSTAASSFNNSGFGWVVFIGIGFEMLLWQQNEDPDEDEEDVDGDNDGYTWGMKWLLLLLFGWGDDGELWSKVALLPDEGEDVKER